MGRKSDTKVKVTGVKLPPKPKPEPVVSFNNAKDHHGRKYVYNPLAKLPYSRHSILYPADIPCGDEDIPLQHGHEGNVGINGASPFLLMAAAHVISIPEQKSPTLRKTVCESLNSAESTAVNMIAIPPAVAGNYRKLIEMVQKPVR